MKKTVILCICLLMFLCSCQQEPTYGEESNNDYTDEYLYQRIDGVYCRINIENAMATPLCPDPLCAHSNESCIFYMIEQPIFLGKYIYYLSGFSEALASFTRLCRFDLTSGKNEVIYETTNGYITQNVSDVGNYIQFCVHLNSNEYNIILFDRESGKLETLNNEPLNIEQTAIYAADERIYWKSQSGELYSTNEAYADRRDGDAHDSAAASNEQATLRMNSTGEIRGKAYLYVYQVTLYDYATKENTVVLEETPAFPFFYSDMILHYDFFDELPIIGYEKDPEDETKTRPVYEKRGGKLYICNRDGSDNRLLLDISDMGLSFSETAWLDGKKGVGDWIGLELYSYENQEDGTIKRGDNRIMLVNINTGEYKLVENAIS